MERLVQGPINPCFHEEHLDVGAAGFLNTWERFTFEEEGEGEPNNYISSSLLDGSNMPFLQMLLHHSGEAPSFFPLTEPNFQTLVRLKNKPWSNNENEKATTVEIQGMDQLESCVTQDVNGVEETQKQKVIIPRERRKRKRQRATKNKEDVESQRMTHIAVERNRRRQMNDHLTALRSLMPTSYVQRGDQASIIGGAIDFVKELEQLLYSLEEQKRVRLGEEAITKPDIAPMYASPSEARAEKKSEAANIEVTVIQEHVNLKLDCRTRSGQLVKAIVGLEQQLRLTVLHLNITASPSQHTVLYSFNLRMEEDCGVRSAEEIASALQQILMNNDSDNEIEKGFS